MRAIVLVLAVAKAQQICVNETVSDSTKIYNCALCRNSSKYLGGDGVTYYIGGGFNDQMITCPTDDFSTQTFKVDTGVTIKSQDLYKDYVIGTLDIVGSDVTVEGGTYTSSINVIGPKATNIKLTNIDVPAENDIVAVRVYRHHEAAELLDVNNLEVSVVSNNEYAMALAHTTDSSISVTCSANKHDQKVLIQPTVPMSQLSSSCFVTDLGEMLSFYGSAYEINFYNFGYKDNSPFLEDMVKWLAIGDAVLLFLLGTCHSSQASSVRARSI